MTMGEFFGAFTAAVFCGFLTGDMVAECLIWASRPRRFKDGVRT